jgi:hypothetical protein
MCKTLTCTVSCLWLLFFTQCAKSSETTIESVVRTIVDSLQETAAYSSDTALLHLLEVTLNKKASLLPNSEQYPTRKIWNFDTSKTGIFATFEADPSNKNYYWLLELHFPDTNRAKLPVLETFLGTSTFPEWSRSTKEYHISVFNSYPPTLPKGLYITGRRSFIDTNGTVYISSMEIRAKR